jgi:hypothetical protein
MQTATLKITKVIVIIFYIALFTGLALYDEKPNDEMVKEMTRPLPEVIEPNNAYIALVGFAAPKGMSPYAYGAEKMQKLKDALLDKKVIGKMINPFDDKKDELSFQGEIPSFSFSEPSKTLEYAAKHSVEIAQLSRNNEELLRRYEMLYTYTHYTEPLDCGYFIYLFLKYDLISGGHRMKFLQLAVRANQGDVAGALVWLRKDAEFWRFIARSSRTSFSKICSFASLSFSLRFAAELGAYRSLNRKELEMVQEILRTFDQGEVNMAETMLGDAHWIIREWGPWDMWNTITERISELNGLFLKQNATKNRMYALQQKYFRLAELPPQKFAIEVKKSQASKYYSFGRIGIPFLYNPAGEILVRMTTMPTYAPLIEERYNMEGRRRLAWLKVLVGMQKVPSEKMQQFLDDHSKDLGDPYTGGPMTWAPEKRSIYFIRPVDKRPVEIFL